MILLIDLRIYLLKQFFYGKVKIIGLAKELGYQHGWLFVYRGKDRRKCLIGKLVKEEKA